MPGILRRPGIYHVIPVVDLEVVLAGYDLVNCIANVAFVCSFAVFARERMFMIAQERINFQEHMFYQMEQERDLSRLRWCNDLQTCIMQQTTCEGGFSR